ncbi:uncharacterized protein KQ657_001583 [Scheffersomyces spartinae]|uniref:glucan endo-1,3-beta-D-glucosidase n=1 Tax=Scheffersomyces spartinae TaxID=45513 RepID=A0A9P7V6W8_9ASCO|nr:uncharacterized protein KQ657_001583 [Scheffersomyces spartinae]KAG7192488.1 hypothetical protein KQ657_001583 [Scheffersomyces spartinae]
MTTENPSDVSSGIEIKFVYAPLGDQSQLTSTIYVTDNIVTTAATTSCATNTISTPKTFTTTEKNAVFYTVGYTTTTTASSLTCSLLKCYTTYYATTYPTTYVTSAEITSIKTTTGFYSESTIVDSKSTSNIAATNSIAATSIVATRNKSSFNTTFSAGPIITSKDAEVISYLDLTTVPTVTSTLYTATTTVLPASTFTSEVSLDTTQQNPVTRATESGGTTSITISFNTTAATTVPTSLSSSYDISEGSSLSVFPSSTSFHSSDLTTPSASQSTAVTTKTYTISSGSSTYKVTSTGLASSITTLVTSTRFSDSSLSGYSSQWSSSGYYNSSMAASSYYSAVSSSEASSSASESISASLSLSVSASSLPSSSSELTSSSSELTSSSSELTSSSSELPSSSSPTSNPSEFTVYAENYNNDYSGDLFAAVDNSAPDSVFGAGQVGVNIPTCVDNGGTPYETNKFYVNLFLGSQDQMVWTYPYGVWWDQTNYYGLGVQHTVIDDRVFGSIDTNNPGVPSYFFNPILNAEMVFSATSLTSSNNHLGLVDMLDMSATVIISPESSCNPTDYIEAPLVQGMGFVTAIYHGSLIVEINSVYGFTNVVSVSSAIITSNTLKYRVTLSTGIEWLLYVTDPSGSLTSKKRSDFGFSISYTTLTASTSIDGLILQAAVAPDSTAQEAYYDMSAGLYTTSIDLTGNASGGSSATYSFEYQTRGISAHNSPLVFLLPHHLESLLSSGTLTDITLESTTKGRMTAILTNTVTMAETLNTDLQFLPWIPGSSNLVFTKEQMDLLVETATSEINVDIQSTVASYHSNYFSGKVIDKYAYILYVINEIIKDQDASATVLAAMKQAFSTFTSNAQYYPLMHDTRFGGVTSTAGPTEDFGSGYYNDHHFHYGYFIHAAAVVGYVDAQQGGTWAEDNKDWVNSLVRDVANPSHSDSYFPVSRMFDWFHGHSWAGGLFVSGDGRNEESSSEDYNFAYGMKLWGRVIGDKSMESRGDLMISIMARSLNMYMLLSDDNTVVPSVMLPNKVSGILFDNKMAYTTYFGTPAEHPEYVHGIHMLPITPASGMVRGSTFVQEEWDTQVSTFFSKSDISWKGILKINQALFDHETSYSFFNSSSWTNDYLDNGLSRTWALAFTGGF